MATYVCKVCGGDVSADYGREIRTSIQHAKEAGHPDGGLCLPDSPHAWRLRGRSLAPGATFRRASPSQARRWWDTLPLQFRVLVALMVLALATIASTALADALDGTPDFLSCEERIAC